MSKTIDTKQQIHPGIYAATLSLVLTNSAFSQSTADRVEVLHATEPVGASQLALRSVLIRGNRINSKSKWKPVLSLSISKELNLPNINVEVRDNRDYGYYMKPTRPCATDQVCEFRWPANKMESIGVGPENLWPLAKSIITPLDVKYIPVCLCDAQELIRQHIVDIVFVPSRGIHLMYTLEDESGNKIMSDTYRDLAAGQPITISFDKLKYKPVKSLKLNVNHVAAAGGTVERFHESYAVLWR